MIIMYDLDIESYLILIFFTFFTFPVDSRNRKLIKSCQMSLFMIICGICYNLKNGTRAKSVRESEKINKFSKKILDSYFFDE